MVYEIRLTEKAERDLAVMPAWLQGSVESYLRQLARSPTSESRTVVSPPYPPGGMMAETDCGPIDGASFHVTVFFHYGRDESSLIVTRIGCYR